MKPADALLILHALDLAQRNMEFFACEMAESAHLSAQLALLARAGAAVEGACPCLPEVLHASDCALHNAPALLPQPCDCGAVAKAQHKYDAWPSPAGCSRLARLKTRLCTWSRRVFG